MIFDKLWRIQWRRAAYIRKTNREIQRLQKSNQHDEAHQLEEEKGQELFLWHEYIQVTKRWPLIRTAERLGEPVWKESEEDYSRYLSVDAQFQLAKH